jgi:phosphoribosyl-ATP pyrophosphohydrolase
VKTFDQLFAELADKARDPTAGLGDRRRARRRVHAIGKKIVEEAAEVWMAAEHESDDAPPRRSRSCSTTCRCSCSPGV